MTFSPSRPLRGMTSLRGGQHALLVRPSYASVSPSFWFAALRAELSFVGFELLGHVGHPSEPLILLWLKADSPASLTAWRSATDLILPITEDTT